MATPLPPVCILCSSILAGSENRRKLHSRSSKHIHILLLSGLVEELYPHAVVTIIHPKSFVCRQCFRGLEKLSVLRKDVERKKEKVRMQVKNAREAYSLQPWTSDASVHPSSSHSKASLSQGTLQKSLPSKRKNNCMLRPRSKARDTL